MSIDVMKQALEALEAGDWYIGQLELLVYAADDTDTHRERAKVRAAITALRAAIKQAQRNEFNPDWDQVEALRESLREHMAEIQRLRQWQSLTDNEIALVCGECAASAHQTDDLSYARAIEAKLREKNT